jgi:excisionase family DNA binding protein
LGDGFYLQAIFMRADDFSKTNFSKLAYGIDELTLLIGISRASLYRAIARGDLKSTKIGRRTLVSKEALDVFLQPSSKRG